MSRNVIVKKVLVSSHSNKWFKGIFPGRPVLASTTLID